jgi:hypothetical protein
LLYRGSHDGFGASNFHSKCDSQSNIVTIILTTKGVLFGGFSSPAWDSSSQDKVDNATSFVFSVRNPHNITDKKVSLANPTNTIYCDSSYGMPVGGGHGIHVADGSHNNTNNYTSLGHSYTDDIGIARNQFFTGGGNFIVKEIEVFHVSDCYLARESGRIGRIARGASSEGQT